MKRQTLSSVALVALLWFSLAICSVAQTGPNCTVIQTTDTQLSPSDPCFGPDSVPGLQFDVVHSYTASCAQLVSGSEVNMGAATPSLTFLDGTGVCSGDAGGDCVPTFNIIEDTNASTVQWSVQNYDSMSGRPGFCAAGDVSYSDVLSCQPTFGTCQPTCQGPAPCANAICNADGTWSCSSGVSCNLPNPGSCQCDPASNTWFCPKTDKGGEAPCNNKPQPNETCQCTSSGTWACDCSGPPPSCINDIPTCITHSWVCASNPPPICLDPAPLFCPDGSDPVCTKSDTKYVWSCGNSICPLPAPSCLNGSNANCTATGWSCDVPLADGE